MTEKEARDLHQSRATDWCRSTFGPDYAGCKPERAGRVLEEAIETAQAEGMTADKMHALVDYVMARPVGEPEAEIGGLCVTLLIYASSLGKSLYDLEEREISRLESSPPEKFRKRLAEKQKNGVEYVPNPKAVQC